MVELGLQPFVTLERLSLRSRVTAERHERASPSPANSIGSFTPGMSFKVAAVLFPEQDEESMVELMGSI